MAPWTAPGDCAPRLFSQLLTFLPEENVRLQSTGVHVGDSYQYVPQGGISDFCNLLLREQSTWGKAIAGMGRGFPSSKDSHEERDWSG